MDNDFSVWTYFDDAQWKEGNAGSSLMIVAGGLSLTNAKFALSRLRRLMPDQPWEIRGVDQQVVNLSRFHDCATLGHQRCYKLDQPLGMFADVPAPPPPRRKLGTRD